MYSTILVRYALELYWQENVTVTYSCIYELM